ncbi:glycosylated lysosomal membrane protein B-like [Homarus americanus]|uniref:glycosylated lysosomal membrane protein B-like n=1 Tax=Homarus americanus TaxID=6706 RepID=UPI001C46AFD3|nr:glycosylated lysosomal membrane protein B-like [Homarus americanus]
MLRWRLLLMVMAGMTTARNVSQPDVNPQCEGLPECEEPWLIHVVATGNNDSIHHLWGIHGAPSFLVVTTSLDTGLNVTWTDFIKFSPLSVTFDEKPIHIFGFSIPNLILFDDTDDSGTLDNSTEPYIVVPMTNFYWEIKEVFNESTRESAVLMETTKFQDKPLPMETKISFQIAAYGLEGRSTVLPHLLRTPNSAQFDMVLDHLVLNLNTTDDEILMEVKETTDISGFKKARWAMDLIIFSSEPLNEEEKGIEFSTEKSLDDENTPGVFHLDQITTKLARTTKQGGYMQWRPVSYLSSDRDINLSTDPNIDGNFTSLTEISIALEESLAYAVFGDKLESAMTAQTKVSFGQKKDKFYAAKTTPHGLLALDMDRHQRKLSPRW